MARYLRTASTLSCFLPPPIWSHLTYPQSTTTTATKISLPFLPETVSIHKTPNISSQQQQEAIPWTTTYLITPIITTRTARSKQRIAWIISNNRSLIKVVISHYQVLLRHSRVAISHKLSQGTVVSFRNLKVLPSRCSQLIPISRIIIVVSLQDSEISQMILCPQPIKILYSPKPIITITSSHYSIKGINHRTSIRLISRRLCLGSNKITLMYFHMEHHTDNKASSNKYFKMGNNSLN